MDTNNKNLDVNTRVVEEKVSIDTKDKSVKSDVKDMRNSYHNGDQNLCKSCPPPRHCSYGYTSILSSLNEDYSQESASELISQLEFLLRCSECIQYNGGLCYSNVDNWGPGGGPGMGGQGVAKPEYGLNMEWMDWTKKEKVQELKEKVENHFKK